MGSRKQEAGSRNEESGSRNQEAGSREQGAESRKREAESRKQGKRVDSSLDHGPSLPTPMEIQHIYIRGDERYMTCVAKLSTQKHLETRWMAVIISEHYP